MQPASYAILATNEAEKTADIKVIDYRMFGATGRVYLSGEESECAAWAPKRRSPRCRDDGHGQEPHPHPHS